MDPNPYIVEQLAAAGLQMRVAVVTETYPPEVNGVAMTIGRTVDGLLRRGHRVQLVRPRQGADEAARSEQGFEEFLGRGLPIPRYSGLRVGLPARGALIRLWAQRRPDVVHIVTEGPLGWSALGAARKLRLPVVSDFHTNFHSYSRHYGLGWLKQPIAAYLRRFHNRSDATLVPTAALQRQLFRQGYRHVHVVARGVDTRLFHPGRRAHALRAAWGMGDEDLAVVYVGRLAPEKNLALLLRAFDAIAARRPDARLVLVGDGPMGPELRRLHPRHIFAGVRLGEDLAAHYASADLFLFPSLTETFGNVTMEALASGLAVVAFDDAGAAEVVRHGENGLLAPRGDESAFLSAAVRAAGDDALRAGLRARAAASVAPHDWEAVHDEFARVITAAVDAHVRRQRAHETLFLAPD